jgi:hypothetical protein
MACDNCVLKVLGEALLLKWFCRIAERNFGDDFIEVLAKLNT